MTHALVSHLQLPVWVDEGLATNIEDMLCASSPLNVDNELARKHMNYWNEETVQDFWSGKAYSKTDEGPLLSYNLAQFLVRKLSKSYDAFANFCAEATYEDGGQEAFINNFELELGDLLTPMLNEGNWNPQPERWFNMGNESKSANG